MHKCDEFWFFDNGSLSFIYSVANPPLTIGGLTVPKAMTSVNNEMKLAD
ncbi:MAG TPA: hypothetical protein VHF65_10405 [Nitrososphaera sp.]|nr:hypothetical protein [Nitrososphaera sp.]